MSETVRKPNTELRRQRELRGWSLKKVAVALQQRFPGVAVTEKEVGRWERGLRVPGPYYREKLCALYNMTAAQLGFIDDSPAELQLPSLPAVHVLTSEQAAALPLHQLAEGTDINMDHLRRALLRLGITGSSLVIVPSMLYVEPMNTPVNEQHMAFLEKEMRNRWATYHTGGAAKALIGLDVWIQEISRCAQLARGSNFHERIHVLLTMSYQLQSCVLRDLMCYPEAYQAHRKAFLVAEALYDPELMAAALAREGITSIQHNKPAEAIISFQRALELIRDLGYYNLEGYILQALSEAQAKMQLDQACWTSLGQAEEVLSQANTRPERSLTRLNAASLKAQRGVDAVLLRDYGRAVQLIDESLGTYDRTLVRGYARLLAQKAEAYHGLGVIDACISNAGEAARLANSVGSSKTIDRVKELHSLLIAPESPWRKERYVAELSAVLN